MAHTITSLLVTHDPVEAALLQRRIQSRTLTVISVTQFEDAVAILKADVVHIDFLILGEKVATPKASYDITTLAKQCKKPYGRIVAAPEHINDSNKGHFCCALDSDLTIIRQQISDIIYPPVREFDKTQILFVLQDSLIFETIENMLPDHFKCKHVDCLSAASLELYNQHYDFVIMGNRFKAEQTNGDEYLKVLQTIRDFKFGRVALNVDEIDKEFHGEFVIPFGERNFMNDLLQAIEEATRL